MVDTHVTEIKLVGRRASDALAVLSRALEGRTVPARQLRASADEASPAEGVALVRDFISVADIELRQALLDVAAALAGEGRGR